MTPPRSRRSPASRPTPRHHRRPSPHPSRRGRRLPAVQHDDGLGGDSPGTRRGNSSPTDSDSPKARWFHDGALYFSDIPNSRIHRWRDDVIDVAREPSGQSNGLTSDWGRRHPRVQTPRAAGSPANPRTARSSMSRRTLKGTASTARTTSSSVPMGASSSHRPAIRDHGPTAGTAVQRRIHTLHRQRTLAARDGLRAPERPRMSPDERTLYIADTNRLHVRVFDIGADGALANGRVFAEMAERRPPRRHEGGPGRPRVRVRGRGVQVFAPDGRPLARLSVRRCPRTAPGGDDGAVLYITARTAVYRARLDTIGIAPHLR